MRNNLHLNLPESAVSFFVRGVIAEHVLRA
jgi:hypothetical protein